MKRLNFWLPDGTFCGGRHNKLPGTLKDGRHDKGCSIIKLTEKGPLFKEWCKKIYSD